MKEILKTIIVEWQERTFEDVFQRDLIIPLDCPMIVSLIGPRRSGKTYLLYDIYRRLVAQGVSVEKLIYINFEDERLAMQVNDLDLILQSYLELYPHQKLSECYFFFDEIQNIDGWEKFVRRLYDTVSRHLFITGSNSKLLSTEIATSLRGRTISFTVLPLSLKEYLSFKKVPIRLHHTQKKAQLLSSIRDFMLQGGCPEVLHFDKELKMQVLQSYFNTMIYRDIIERYKISDTQILKYFIKKIFAGVGKPLSINRIYNDLRSQGYKVTNNALYAYQEYCQSIFMTVSITKFDFSEIKQAKSERKTYSIDTGLLSSVDFSLSENNGMLFENMVLLEFLKAQKDVFYYKDKYECDFIIKDNFSLHAFQVSLQMDNEETKSREIRGLVEACQKLGLTTGTIITFDQKEDIVYKDVVIKIIPFYSIFAI